jgi:hypothetical protein
MLEDNNNDGEHVVEEAQPPITIGRAKRMFQESLYQTQANDELCLRDSQFYHHEQLPAEAKAKLKRRGQPEVVINRIAPAVNGLLGIFDASEGDPEAYPRNDNDQDAAETATKVLRYLADKANLKSIRRTLSENYFIEGTCAVLVGDGVHSNAKFVPVTPILWEDFFYDPLSRFHDFSDAKYLGIAVWRDAEDLKDAYPDKADMIAGCMSDGGILQSKNDTEERNKWVDKERKRIRVVEMYFRQHSEWFRVLFCGNDFLEFGPSAYHDDDGNSLCPILAASFAIRRDTGDRYGAIRQLIDPQTEINARRSKLLHLTNNRSVQTTTADADPINKEIARQEAAKADGVMPYGYEARNAPDLAEGQMLILQQSQQDIDRMAPTPATLSRFGSGDSGRAREILQKAGYTEWSRAFARIEDLELRIYRQIWFAARQFLTSKMVVRVTGEFKAPEFLHVNVPIVENRPQPVMDPNGQPVMDMMGRPQVQMVPTQVGTDKALAEMDCDIVLDTVPDTPTLEMEVWQELLRYAASAGVRVTDPEFKFLIMASPLPNKNATIARLEAIMAKAQEETAPQQQMQQQMQQQEQQLNAAHVTAKAHKDTAQAQKAEADAAKTRMELEHMANTQVLAQFLKSGMFPPIGL